MTIDSDVLDSGVGTTLSDVVADYENGASLNEVIYGTDNLTSLGIDTDTETFLQTYTVNHTAYWDGVYAAASSGTTTQPVQEAIRGFVADVSASALEQQKSFALTVNTVIKDTVAVSGTIEQATVAYLDGQPVGLYYEKATGNFILSTTTPSSTYYIPAGEYMAGAAKGVEAAMIYETFKAPAVDAYNATLGDEQAPFDAEKDYLVAATTTLVGGAVAGEFGGGSSVLKAALFALFGTAGGVTADQLTSDVSATVHDAKVNGYTESQTLAAVQDQIKSEINANWSATGTAATAILDKAEDLASDLDNAINGLVHGPNASYWVPAAPVPAPLEGCMAPWAAAPSETDPLVIDLSSGHTGITLTTYNAATTTTFYDLNNTGFAVQTAWTSGTTGFLVQQNIDGTIGLFGNTGGDGFADLAKLDSDHNLRIDANDTAWSSLKVWVDSNGDGLVESGELSSLSSLGITSIDLAGVTPSTSTIDGNSISHTSTVTFSDGSTTEIADAHLVHSSVDTVYDGSYTLDPETMFLPDLRGYGTLPELTVAMSQDSTLKGEVADFATDFSTSGFASFTDSDIADILYQWAGVAGVASDARGPYVDARQLEFLEHIFGQDYFQLETQSANPQGGAAPQDIDASWNMVLEQFKDQLVLQAGGSSLFANPVTYDPSTGTVSGDTSLSHTGITALDDNAPSPGAENVAYWVQIAHFLDTVAGLSTLTSTENGWLNDAVQASDSSLTWDDVKSAIGNSHPGSDINGTTGDDVLYGLGTDDSITGDGGHDLIYTGDGNVTVTIGADSSTVFGGAGTDTIYGGDGGDTIHLGDGTNTVYGGAGNDTVYCGAGIDTVHLGDGTNVIHLGTGGEVVSGGSGNDTYYYEGGNALINEYGGTNLIVLPSGITSADVTFWQIGNVSADSFDDLLIQINDGTTIGTIQIRDQFYAGSTAPEVQTLEFSDSSTVNLTSLTSMTWALTGGETVSVPSGSGNIDAQLSNGGNNLTVSNGNNTIEFISGNNHVHGGSGNDTYIVGPGFNVIDDTAGTNTLVIPTGYTMSDITLSRVSGTSDMLITIAGLGEIKITDEFDSSGYGIQDFHFLTDSSTVAMSSLSFGTIGTSGNDTLTGATVNVGGNWFDGRGGNDAITGGVGDNTYNFGAGFGTDTISEPYHTGNTNKIELHGLDPSNIRMWTDSNGYLHLQDITDTSHSITVNAGVTDTGNYESTIGTYLESVVFDDSTTWDLTGGLTLTASNAGDTLYGTAYNDILNGGSGADVIYGNSGNDTIIGGAGADNLYGGTGNDTYKFSSGFGNATVHESTGQGTDTIHFSGIDPAHIRMWTDDNGYLYLQDSADTSHYITVQAGVTGTGNYESTVGSNVEQVTFDSSYATTWDLTGALTLTASNSGDTLYGTAYNDTLIGGSGNDVIYGNSGNDTITGGTGADNLYGGTGNDTYNFSSGFGNATVHESTGQGTDTIHFSGIDPSHIRMWTDDNGYLYLQDSADTSHYITVQAGVTGAGNYESTVGSNVEQVTFDSSYATTWDLTGGLNITGDSSGTTLYGTAYGDTITGGSGSEYIYGNAGNDTIYGAGGNDHLIGGAGADTFLFKGATALTGVDTITDFNTSQGDKIDLADVISTYDPATMAIANFVQLATSDSDTQVKVDTDGSGTSYTQIATIQGVTGLNLTDLIADGNLIVHHT